MVAKRELFPKNLPLAKRLRTIETQVRRNRPEMQTRTRGASQSGYATTDGTNPPILIKPCEIAQGDAVGNRHGNSIRVWRIEVRGIVNGRMDLFILQKKTTSDPGHTSFTEGETGCFIKDDLNVTQFTEWGHFTPNTDDVTKNRRCKYAKSFKGGLLVQYNGAGSTNAVSNEIVIVGVNRTTGTGELNLTVRLWYTDA